MKRKKLNFEIIESNLSEAIEELEGLRGHIANKKLSEEEFQIRLLHAYHHLNFAWNIRHVATREYANLTEVQFEQWGKYPSDISDIERI